MSSFDVAANAMGTLGAICWSIQLIPQIWQNHRRQHTHGLQPTMMLLWASAGIPLGIYNIIRSFPIALQIQPQILTFLSLLTWTQTQYYPPARDVKPRSIMWCMMALTIACLVAGGVEVGIIFAIRTATDHRSAADIESYWPVVLMGALAATLLCAGVGRHYVDIWKERTVRGISFIFVGLDAMGDLTSLLSVIFWWKAGQNLDVLGLVVYASELVLWLGVFACGGYYNLRPWLKSRLEKHETEEASNQSAEAHTGIETLETAQRITSRESGNSSINSRASHNSGTVFRTASARSAALNTAPGLTEGEDFNHDLLRLRSIVQV